MKKFLLFIVFVLILLTSLQLWTSRQKQEVVQGAGEQGEAAIGGDFTLTDQNGKTVHAADFRGRVMLVYFGFTHCPDICPIAVGTISKAMEKLGAKGDQVAPIFITVDPERDTPAILKDYLANFDHRMIGLTGTPEQIKQVAGAYKAYFAKKNIPWSQEDPAEDHDHMDHMDMHGDPKEADYSVDHSGFIYMMGKDGKYLQVFPSDAPENDIVHAIESHLS